MEMVRYWVTEDGQQFDTESAAIKHEDQLHYEAVKDDCICLDDQFNRITPINFPDRFNLMYLKTEEAYSWWKNYTEELGYVTDGVESPGMYLFNYDSLEWDNLEEQIEKLMEAKKTLEGA